MGLIVDDVEEVANIAPGDIEETPDFGMQIDTDYILGMAKIKGVVKSLLDIDRVVTGEALHAMTQSLPAA
jgi:purine-binding chemotaxis protein CheW